MASNVNLIDPNKTFSQDKQLVNASPDYEKMFIFVELTAERRGRTMLTSTGSGIVSSDVGLGSDVTINMMGFNQDKDSNNNGQYTTNYYEDGSEGVKYEGFGIENIQVRINSSYIPEIEIEFIDVRGLSFFNKRTDSPYSVLFDFPPPIFNLTIKGYYGKSLTYQLHLVKNNTRFDSETGNYYITSNFVARTFAPLTDIPFKYIINSALIRNSEPTDPDILSAPTTTYELIEKTKGLYDKITDKVKNSEENQLNDQALKRIDSNQNFIDRLSDFSLDLDPTYIDNTNYIIYNDNPSDDNTDIKNFKILKRLSEYNNIIKGFETEFNPEKVNNRVYIGIKYKSKKEDGSDVDSSGKKTTIENILLEYKNELINFGSTLSLVNGSINENDISNPTIIREDFPTNSTNTVDYNEYVCIDITNIYVKIFKDIRINRRISEEQQELINNKINALVAEQLGMKPTIYNIFKIICDDIDTFFNIIRDTSLDAIRHHETYEEQILNNNDNVDDRTQIYPFPLYIETKSTPNGIKKVRMYPKIDLPEPFPEVVLVDDFINTFVSELRDRQVRNLRTQESNDSGNNKWIPPSPLDSELLNDDYNSPYFNVSNRLDSDNVLKNYFNIALKRFYILSQNSYALQFYNVKVKKGEIQNNNFIKFLAESEAVNLAASLNVDNNIFENIINKSNAFKTNNGLNEFYNSFLENNINDYDFNDNTKDSFKFDGSDIELYRAKVSTPIDNEYNFGLFEGLKIIDEELTTRNSGNGSDSIIDRFIDENKNIFTRYLPNIFGDITSYTKENVIYVKDSENNNESRYLLPQSFIIITQNGKSLIRRNEYEYNSLLNRSTEGNNGLKTVGRYNNFGNIIEIFATILSRIDTTLIENINNNQYSRELLILIFNSCFGHCLSPFNVYGNNLNKLFKNPSIFEVPTFYITYLAALVNLNNNQNLQNEVSTFFESNIGKLIAGNGVLISADKYDINNSLSRKDKNTLLSFYNNFDYGRFITSFKSLYNTVLNDITNLENSGASESDIIKAKKESYKNNLEGFYKNSLIDVLMTEKYLAVYNEITFANIDDNNSNGILFGIGNRNESTYQNTINNNPYYQSLKSINESNENKKLINDNYFKLFFEKLATQLQVQRDKLNNIEKEFNRNIDSDDILNKTYYSFKNINDKWISGTNKNIRGFPLNRPDTSDTLIDKFAFVDRAMNPIGNELVINPEILIELADDPNVSIFTVFSKILSLNGFEFFPLQNFMSFQEKDWENSFKIFETVNQDASPGFVCMYIGGTENFLNGTNNGFLPDGILELDNEDLPDFNNSNIEEDDLEETINTNFPYKQVRAFRVRYAEQNQSYFYNINIDSKEYPETNESLAILSRLAGDNKKQSPVPIGQNLYTLYENRAYTVNVEMLGNVMIQPTQYFQLENIPLFSGPYVVLYVEHNIKPNHMTTKFGGVKILKYPNPIITQAAVFANNSTGNTDNTSGRDNSNDDVIANATTSSNPGEAQYNSMYTLTI